MKFTAYAMSIQAEALKADRCAAALRESLAALEQRRRVVDVEVAGRVIEQVVDKFVLQVVGVLGDQHEARLAPVQTGTVAPFQGRSEIAPREEDHKRRRRGHAGALLDLGERRFVATNIGKGAASDLRRREPQLQSARALHVEGEAVAVVAGRSIGAVVALGIIPAAARGEDQAGKKGESLHGSRLIHVSSKKRGAGVRATVPRESRRAPLSLTWDGGTLHQTALRE